MCKKPVTTKAEAEKVVKDIRRATRKVHCAEENIRIFLVGLRGEDSIADLCRREGIAQSLYYSWSKEFLNVGKKRLAGDTARQATSTEVKTLRTIERSSLTRVNAKNEKLSSCRRRSRGTVAVWCHSFKTAMCSKGDGSSGQKEQMGIEKGVMANCPLGASGGVRRWKQADIPLETRAELSVERCGLLCGVGWFWIFLWFHNAYICGHCADTLSVQQDASLCGGAQSIDVVSEIWLRGQGLDIVRRDIAPHKINPTIFLVSSM